MKNKYKKTFLIYNLTAIPIAILFYFIIPILLNFPPNSINNEFEKNIDMGVNYYAQYIGIVFLIILVSNISIIFEMLRLKKWKNMAQKDSGNGENIRKIKQICFNSPLKLYILHAILPSIVIMLVMILTGAGSSLASRISIILFAVYYAMGLLVYVSLTDTFKNVLSSINNDGILKNRMFGSLKTRIFFQFLPLLLLIGTIVFVVTNGIAIREKGEILYKEYNNLVKESELTQATTIDEAKTYLRTIAKLDDNDTKFIIKSNPYEVIYSDKENAISDFFIKYTFMQAKDGRTYGYYATDIEGTYVIIQINGEEYAVGIMYNTTITSGYTDIVIATVLLFLVAIIFLIYFAYDMSAQVNTINLRMKELIRGAEIDYDKKIPVTSNDELGELTVSFNEILDLEKKHVETIKGNQDALVESGRLSSLGQMIGGIAHNLKTPIMSISGNLQGIQDLITEYHSSVGDPEVTEEDHKAIASDMQELVDKTRVYLTYMSDIITAVKGQAVQMDSSEEQVFGVLEVLNRIDVLMKHELKSALIEMVTSVQEEAKTAFIRGDINSLVQVINNLIQNAIYSYEGRKNETIEFTITKEGKVICLKLRDYGCGISDAVKDKLFKEMITTKGKNGTGLGLYMSYSTIIGKFKGDFTFESEQGKGTTFYIKIPTI